MQTGRRQRLGRVTIELAFEPARERDVRVAFRARVAGRRHHARAKLADHVLPLLGIRRDVVELHGLERQIADLLGVAVTVEAVVADRRLVLRDRAVARRLAAGRRDGGDAE
jgi:hypothetical protein